MNTVCDRDWPEDFEHENGEYMNTCCECKNTFTGHKRRFICKACSTSQGGEAVAWMLADAVGGSMLEFQRDLLLENQCRYGGEIVPLYTHPAEQVADDLTMVKASRELLDQIAVELEHDNDRYLLGREIRALLNGGRK